MKETEVHITPGQPQKYVHVYIVDGGEKVPSLWGNPNAEYHKDIVQEIEEADVEIEYVDGGGRIHLFPDTQEIYVWDTSTKYGDADSESVHTLLRNAYPEHTIILNAPNY